MPRSESGLVAPGPTIQRRIRAALTERLGYKAAALFFALVLWLIVSAEEPSEELVPVRLEAEFDSTRFLMSPRPAIRALVAGRARDLIKLYDTPPVVRPVVPIGAPETITYEIVPSEVFIPPGVDAIVRDVQPRSLRLTFDLAIARRVPVTSAVALAVDTTVPGMREMRLSPDSVEVIGPRTAVRQIQSVSTIHDTVAVRDSGDFLIPLDLTRLGLNVRVRPAQVRLSVLLRPLPAAQDTAPDTLRRGATAAALVRPE